MQIKMGSISGSVIPPKSTRAVFQWVAVNNPQQVHPALAGFDHQ